MSTAADTVDFREKAHAMAVVALEDAFHRAVDPETSLKLKLEFTELCTKLADLHPKQQQQQIGGPGFSISIVFDSKYGEKPVNVIDVQAAEDVVALPDKPAFLRASLENADLSLPEDFTC